MLLDSVAVKPKSEVQVSAGSSSTSPKPKPVECGYNEILLYTNAAMHENLAMYAKVGYECYRNWDSDFHRVFFRKSLCK